MRQTSVKIGLRVLGGVFVAFLIVPPLITLACQSWAGAQIEAIQQTLYLDGEADFYCARINMPAISTSDRTRIEKATQVLRWSLRATPKNAHSDFLQGRAYCLADDYEEAVRSLSLYTLKRPDNPLGLMEEGFAYFSWAETLSAEQESLKNSTLERAMLSFEQAGITRPLLGLHGDHAFESQNYSAAYLWYRLADQYDPLTDLTAFRLAVLNLAMASDGGSTDFLPAQFRLILEGAVEMKPSNFFRLASGAPVRMWEIDGRRAGVYFKNSDPGGVFIKAVSSGDYCLKIEAQDLPPLPTHIEVSLDLEPVDVIKLTQGDGAWVKNILTIPMDAGWHLLSLRLENDGKVGDVDRNALVGTLTLQKCH